MSMPYMVSPSQSVLVTLKEIARKARSLRRQREFGVNLKWMMQELERTPLEFGEARYADGDPGLKIRVGFVGPVMVRYAVHEESRTVFIGRVRAKL